MSTLKIPISDTLREFVEARASSEGFPCAEDYVQALIQKTHREWQNEQLATKLQVGIDELARGEGGPMTQADWDLLYTRIGEQQDRGQTASPIVLRARLADSLVLKWR